LQRSQQLLYRFPTVRSLWFTDEKIFTIETLLNSPNDRVYANNIRKRDVLPVRLIRDRQHFSQKVMVSVVVSRMGKTDIVFIEPGAKFNSEYYCQHVLGGGLLYQTSVQDGSVIRGPCSRAARRHTARNTLTYLRRENVAFIEPDMWPQTART